MTFCASPSADHVKREPDGETYRQLLHGSTLDRTLFILAFSLGVLRYIGLIASSYSAALVVCAVEEWSRRMATTRVVSAGTACSFLSDRLEKVKLPREEASSPTFGRPVEIRRNLPLVKAIPAPYPPFRAFLHAQRMIRRESRGLADAHSASALLQ
jgi:hypothetical protein